MEKKTHLAGTSYDRFSIIRDGGKSFGYRNREAIKTEIVCRENPDGQGAVLIGRIANEPQRMTVRGRGAEINVRGRDFYVFGVVKTSAENIILSRFLYCAIRRFPRDRAPRRRSRRNIYTRAATNEPVTAAAAAAIVIKYGVLAANATAAVRGFGSPGGRRKM